MDDKDPIEFAEPYLQMTCIDPALGTDPAVLAEFTKYYTQVHTPDVVRNNPGIKRAYRYELAFSDPGAFGPKWLSIYEWESRHGAQVFVVRGEAPGGSWRPDYLPEPPIWSAIGRGPTQWGRLMCNRLAESGPPGPPPNAILMEGFDPPAGLDAAGTEAFRSSFVSSHGLKIDAEHAYSRVTKYELEELGTRPATATGKPRYLAVYEADAVLAAAYGGNPPPPAEAAEPAWQRRKIVWRHVYRRVSGCIYPGARYTAEML